MEFRAGQIPSGTKWSMAAQGLTGALYAHLNALHESVGEEKYKEIVRRIWGKIGQACADAVESMGMLTGKSAKSIGEAGATFCICSMGPEYKMEVVEASEDRMVVKILECPWKNRMTESGTSQDLLSACDVAFWDNFIKSLNPHVTMRHGKQMHRGDPYCEWIFENKKTG